MRHVIAFLTALFISGSAVGIDRDGSYNGAWYDPSDPGFGIIIDSDAETGTFWFFTYDPDGEGQAWYISDSPPSPEVIFGLYRPQGDPPTFGSFTNVEVGEQIGTATVYPLSLSKIRFSWSLCLTPQFSPNACDGERDLVRVYPRD